jgi:hypothetical protein
LGRVGSEVITIWNKLAARGHQQFRLSPRRVILAGIAVTLIFAVISPFALSYGSTPEAESQKELAGVFEDTNSETIIYIEDGALQPRHYTFAFYVNRPLQPFSAIESDKNTTQYAIVKSSSLPEIDNEYSVMRERGRVAVVEIHNHSS